MISVRFLPAIAAWASLAAIGSAAAPTAAELDFFEKKIRPVLVQHCYKCHSADALEVKGELLLDTRAGVQKGGESGPVLKAGDPAGSRLVKALRHTDKNLAMPPDKKLPDSVIADIETWIRNGAADPREGATKLIQKSGPITSLAEARQFWAFRPVAKVALPQTKNANWPRTDVDRFVLAGLEAKGLQPVADNNPAALLRRVYYDLIGLPPAPSDVEAFAKNPSAQALEHVVDTLLASPQFGERWGRHWLDVARYGESNGNTDNFLFPHAWRYRDFVINAFNADMPFDRFVQLQIAGDLMRGKSPTETESNIVATGFLALASKPRAQNNPDYGMDLVADQIEVTTTAVMGLTVACARCHDHKFDPISMKEYYSLAGIFTSSDMLYALTAIKGGNAKKGGGATGLHALQGNTADKKQTDEIAKVETELQTARATLNKLVQAASVNKNANAVAAKPAAANAAQLGSLSKAERQELKKALRQAEKKAEAKAGNAKDAAPAKVADSPQIMQARQTIQALETRLEKLKAELPQTGRYAMGLREGRIGDCAICLRGESQKRGDIAPRGFVSVVNYTPNLKVNIKQSGRLELAQWLTSRQNPLTARVYVNRVWQHLFGEGLVRTPDNFGNLGEKPSHPELLDHLAGYFVDQSWSTKRLIKMLVLTRTYQLGTTYLPKNYETDPENRLLWRQAPRRLDAEAIRDSVLAVSGRLESKPFVGTPLESYGEQEIRTAVAERFIAYDNQHRSVYLPQVRNAAPEVLSLFDAADSSLIVGSRSVTTVPAQALYLMNSKFVRENAARAAEELLKQSKDDSTLVDQAYLRAYARKPSSVERERVAGYLAKAMADAPGTTPEQKKVAAWTNVWQALLSAAEFRYLN